jgi:hypothetical protein
MYIFEKIKFVYLDETLKKEYLKSCVETSTDEFNWIHFRSVSVIYYSVIPSTLNHLSVFIS